LVEAAEEEAEADAAVAAVDLAEEAGAVDVAALAGRTAGAFSDRR
jgi:hypothetical protein